MDSTTKKLLKMIQSIEDLGRQQEIFHEIDEARKEGSITIDEYHILRDVADWYGYGKYINALNHAGAM